MRPEVYPFYKKETVHERTLNGKTIHYKTIAEDIPVKDEAGQVMGTVFAYEYLKLDTDDLEKRPVLFAYNGGPGASAVWLHSGFLGPVRFVCEDLDHPEFGRKTQMEENPEWFLDTCDIVILDPPGVGYGTIADAKYAEKLFGCEPDALCIAQVIEQWLIEHDRLYAPLYLLGESYGTIRNCIVADILTGGPCIPGMMSKVIRVSGIIMMGNAAASKPSMLSCYTEKGVSATALALPAYAAVNWYHEDVKEDSLESRVTEAYAFAADEYVRAAYLGTRMSQEEKEQLIQKMSHLTGICASYLRNHNLELNPEDFQRKLLEEKGKIISLYDGRMTLAYTDGPLDPYADDAVLGPYGYVARNAFEQICKEEFQMDLKRPFSSVDFAVNGAWGHNVTVSPFESLSRCIRRNASLRVLFASGVYDLTTMIGQTSYMAGQLHTARPEQVQVREYPSGHMTYIGKESVKTLAGDFRTFIKEGVGD